MTSQPSPGRPARTPGGQSPATPPLLGGRRNLPIIAGLLIAFLLAASLLGRGTSRDEISYSAFLDEVRAGRVDSVEIDQSSGKITGALNGQGDTEFVTQGPRDEIPDADVRLLDRHGVDRDFREKRSNILPAILSWVIPIGLVVLLWRWTARKARGQMSGLMSIGRSRAKLYVADRPTTTFADVAGYEAVKTEIREVVDFLKDPRRFRGVGARPPKGVLLVGPPGTGKTLIARAVAGQASVPFISVSGSDFMEMFVGVGASRVRDLFGTARKQAPAIIFVDEIDSIGRKRGAGLGGGHDEREQTLNQLLSEMDGFEATEGIVMIAATNRPDVLDPALLRPGRFDRQVVVPLPTQEERLAILEVHCHDKRMSRDVDLGIVARGTPGMSGAELANLVNEAALFAARRGATELYAEDFDLARDRVIMGVRRDSMALSATEKQVVAYHEAGHALLTYVLPHADPLHKVTILPTGMALGATQQLPVGDKHIHQRDYLDDSLAVRLGGRVAEQLVYGQVSTGAQNDLVASTELARKMVREWGMSERLGPMAWGQQDAVFLGEDLLQSRHYSDVTAHVVDEEVERILRQQERRAAEVLDRHRPALDVVARSLLERETLDGAEVGRIVDEIMTSQVDGRRLRRASANGVDGGRRRQVLTGVGVEQRPGESEGVAR